MKFHYEFTPARKHAIKFAKNYNGKLDRPEFTTIRLHGSERVNSAYAGTAPSKRPGEIVSIVVANVYFCDAEVLSVRVCPLAEITESDSQADGRQVLARTREFLIRANSENQRNGEVTEDTLFEVITLRRIYAPLENDDDDE